MVETDRAGHLFVRQMESKGHISRSNIEPLIDAITQLRLHGLRTEVDSLINKYVRKGTPQEDDSSRGTNQSSRHTSSNHLDDEEPNRSSEEDDDIPMSDDQKRCLDRFRSKWKAEGTDWESIKYAKILKKKHALTKEQYNLVKNSVDKVETLFAILKTKPSWVAEILPQQSDDNILVKLKKWTTMEIPDDMREEINGQPTRTINVVLIGKTGSGKSSTGNTILGKKNKFGISKSSWSSCSKHVEMIETVENNVTLKVMDTPGLFDTDSKRGNSDVFLEFTKMALQFPEGVHVFLIVCRNDSPFTDEEKATISELEGHFGRKFLQRSILVFTRADAGGDLAESMGEAPDVLKKIHENVSKRTLIIENNPSDPSDPSYREAMLRMQRLWLISAIEKLASEGEPYHEKLFSEVNKITARKGDTLERLLKTILVIYSYLREEVIRRSDEDALDAMKEKGRLSDQELKRLREVPEIAGNIKSLEDENVSLEDVVRNGLSRYKAEIDLTIDVSEEFRKKIKEVVDEYIKKLNYEEIYRLSKELRKNNVPTELVDELYNTKSERANTAMNRDELEMVVKTVITSNLNIIEEIRKKYWDRVPMLRKFAARLCIR